MSRIPILGSAQLDARLDGTPPRLRTRSLLCVRAWDGIIAPLNEGMSVDYLGRSTTATIYASDGTSGALVASAPAFSSEDWDGDAIREEDALVLSDEEALRYYDASSEQLLWDTTAKVIRLDGYERGNSMVDGAPYFSFTNDAASGAYLAVLGSGDGKIGLHHYNGTSTVVSELPVFDGDRFSFIGQYSDNGSVRVRLVRNGGSDSVGALSAALLPETVWGGGAGVKARINEFGDALRGEQALRYLAVYGGTATRQQLLEVL